MEQTHYNLLLRWFLDLSIDDAVWNHSTFSKNHDRLLEHEAMPALFAEVVRLAESRGLLSKGFGWNLMRMRNILAASGS